MTEIRKCGVMATHVTLFAWVAFADIPRSCDIIKKKDLSKIREM